jgi:hypothetical protein
MFEYEKAPGKPFFAARITDVEQRCSCGEYFIRSDTLLSIKSSSLLSPIGWLWRPGRLSSRSFAQRHVSSPPRPTTWDGCFRGAAGCRSAPLPPPECSDETVGVQSKAACFACKTNNKNSLGGFAPKTTSSCRPVAESGPGTTSQLTAC